MRIIAISTLREFWKRHPQAEMPLRAWNHTVSNLQWDAPFDIKTHYPNASILAGNRVCFNISGNKYRLVVQINYHYHIVYIRFIGTHKEYDRIDANTI